MLVRRVLLIGLLAACLAASACSSPFASLVDEQAGAAAHSRLSRRFAATPNHTHLVPTRGTTGREVKLAVHELGDRTNPTLVLIHGVFSDGGCWRFLGGELLHDYHLLIVDLPGCGQSDLPDARSLDAEASDVYAPRGIAWRTLEALTAVFDTMKHDRSPRSATLPVIVAHSLGGLVAINMLADHTFPQPLRATACGVDGLVLFAPLDCCVAAPNPLFLDLERISGPEVTLGSMLGVLDRRVATSISDGVVDSRHAFALEARRRCEILRNPATRRAMQAMLRYAIPLAAEAQGFSPDWDAIAQFTASYAAVQTRTLIISGERDNVLPVSMSYKIWAQIPRAELRIFAGAKHSPQIERPSESAALLREFLDPGSTLARLPKPNPAMLVEPVQATAPPP